MFIILFILILVYIFLRIMSSKKNKAIEEKDKSIEEQNNQLDSAISLLYTNKIPIADIATQLAVGEEKVIEALKRKGLK